MTTLSPASTPPASTAEPRTREVRVAIVGSGFSGLGMAIQLRRQGADDFVVLERAGDVGGTWRDNTYPGCACDVPSHLYSFSFEPNPRWTRSFSPRAEIWDYLRHCARKYGVLPHIRFNHELREACWDESRKRWIVETSGGTYVAQVLVAATGALSEPKTPPLPGLENFRGTVFHSARWNHDHDLRGRRVAVVGTGASAIQFVPRIRPQVAHLDVYQRTAAWIMPHPDRPLRRWERRIYSALPALQLLMRGGIYWARETFVIGFMRNRMRLAERIARRHLTEQVPDPTLRRKLTPDYTIGCKRILLSDDFYPALQQPNVELVTAGIREVREHSIVAEDGVEREADTIIFGTGFQVTEMPVASHIVGREGVRLADVWQGSPQALLGAAITGFPNFFMMLGPNTGLGHTSQIVMIEGQIKYIAGALGTMRSRGAAVLEALPFAQAAFNDEVQRRLQPTVWNSGGCRSWYLDRNGRNSTLWPGSTWSFRNRTRRFDPGSFRLG
ncbi:MAG TPA: NAD(P)/FAD-dependent oxidoreductase [Candidatus Dormibacteraeota bacterium]|jgi:cation diffusion facilitator CzcD-associated flavoprotein CzcO|nr:NAD(P)/FAD-dependent oxidoreductase [Candidatus Dormibacteraeota bacterium]